MLEIGMVNSAIESAKTIGGIAKTMMGLNVSVEVNKVAIDLNMQILDLIAKLQDARMAEYASHEKLRELENQLRDKEAFQRELENYALVSPWPGGFVYARRHHVEVMQRPHYLCTACVENSKKSILQATHEPGKWTRFNCHVCHLSIETDSMGPVPAEYTDY